MKNHGRVDSINSFTVFAANLILLLIYFVFSETVLDLTVFKDAKNDFDYYENLVFSKEENETAKKFKRDLADIGLERGAVIPGTIIYKYKPVVREILTFNSDGFRNEEFRKKEKNEFRIALFGDSRVLGFSVKKEDAIPSIIEKNLRKRFKRNITVLNMGVEAYDIQREIAAARYYNEKIEPDMVVFYSAINDLRGTFIYGNISWEPFKGDETLPQSIDESVYNKIRVLNTLKQTYISDRAKITARIQKSDFAVLPIQVQKEEFAEKFPETFLGRISDAAGYFDKLGILSVFILTPQVQIKKPLSDIEKQILYLNEIAFPGINLFSLKCISGVKNALKTGKYSGNIIDYSEIFNGNPDTVFYDGVHYTPEALRVEADKITEDIAKILENGKYFE